MVDFSTSEIHNVQSVWDLLRNDPIIDAHSSGRREAMASAFFCQQFYDNLLSEHPDLKLLFPSIRQQAAAMADTLDLVIINMADLSRVETHLSALGRIHSRIIGVQASHYEVVGEALLHTLHDRYQESFTPELDSAWKKLYCYIANTMMEGDQYEKCETDEADVSEDPCKYSCADPPCCMSPSSDGFPSPNRSASSMSCTRYTGNLNSKSSEISLSKLCSRIKNKDMTKFKLFKHKV